MKLSREFSPVTIIIESEAEFAAFQRMVEEARSRMHHGKPAYDSYDQNVLDWAQKLRRFNEV